MSQYSQYIEGDLSLALPVFFSGPWWLYLARAPVHVSYVTEDFGVWLDLPVWLALVFGYAFYVLYVWLLAVLYAVYLWFAVRALLGAVALVLWILEVGLCVGSLGVGYLLGFYGLLSRRVGGLVVRGIVVKWLDWLVLVAWRLPVLCCVIGLALPFGVGRFAAAVAWSPVWVAHYVCAPGGVPRAPVHVVWRNVLLTAGWVLGGVLLDVSVVFIVADGGRTALLEAMFWPAVVAWICVVLSFWKPVAPGVVSSVLCFHILAVISGAFPRFGLLGLFGVWALGNLSLGYPPRNRGFFRYGPPKDGIVVARYLAPTAHLCARPRRRARWVRSLEEVVGKGGTVGQFVAGRWTPDLPSSNLTSELNLLLARRPGGVRLCGGATVTTKPSGQDELPSKLSYYVVESSLGVYETVCPALVSYLSTYAFARVRDDTLLSSLRSRAIDRCKRWGLEESLLEVFVPTSVSWAWVPSPRELEVLEGIEPDAVTRHWWG